jgi:hypothetical protein
MGLGNVLPACEDGLEVATSCPGWVHVDVEGSRGSLDRGEVPGEWTAGYDGPATRQPSRFYSPYQTHASDHILMPATL